MRMRRSALSLALVLLAVPSGWAQEKPDPIRTRYCGLMRGCGLEAPEGWCPEDASRGIPGLKYDDTRCKEARDLSARGVRKDDLPGYRLYAFLGHRYRVEYTVKGEVAVSAARLSYLMSELPLAAHLLTDLQGTRYTAEYLDESRRGFRGSKGGKLSGQADLVSGSPQEGVVWYFGDGASRVGPWKLRGRSLMRFAFAPAGATGQAISYDVRIVTTPSSGFLNAIMSMGLFKSIVNGEIREMVEDVTEASGKLAAQASRLQQSSDWSAEEKEKLGALLRLP
ncbi:MAG TPA: hypothetical protein VFQ51_00830 [Vicinamibacteria bacterium]|nr:hypothetical protein [Vicinamibacteria bacterium]